MPNETAKYLVLAVVFLCAVKTSTTMPGCTVPGPNHKPLTIEDRIQKAPVAVRGYLVRKIGNGSIYRACLYITRVYRGYLSSSYICADNFGVENVNASNSTVNCLSDLKFDVKYLILLDKTARRYRARYDEIGGAAVPYNNDIKDDIRDALCCPRKLGSKEYIFFKII